MEHAQFMALLASHLAAPALQHARPEQVDEVVSEAVDYAHRIVRVTNDWIATLEEQGA